MSNDFNQLSGGYFKNNFDFIRILAASMVLFSHQFALSGFAEPRPLPGLTLGSISVAIFFVISGYLISSSWINEPNLWKFTAKRILRLFPALAFVVFLSVFFLGPALTQLSIPEYFKDRVTWDYLSNIYLEIRYALPGVFNSNPYPSAVNGSLWTLPYEFKWYLIVALLGITRLIKFKLFLIPLFILIVIYEFKSSLPNGLPRIDSLWYLGIFFLGGMVLSVMRISGKTYLLIMLASIILYSLHYWFFAFTLALPVSIIYFGSKSFPFIRNIAKFGDISYGVSLFAFPVQQTILYLLGGATHFWILLSLSLIFTYLLAFISWKFVEEPSLGLKRFIH